MAPLDDPEDHHRLLRLATRVRRPRPPVPAPAAARSWTATPPAAASRTPMAAALRTEDRVHGLLLVGGRLGDVTTFTSQRPRAAGHLRPPRRHLPGARPPGGEPPPGHRPQGAAAAPGAARPADRAAQPHPVPGPRAARRRHRRSHRASGRPSCTSTSTASSRSTTPSATRPATCCCAPSPTGCAAACARPTPPPASAATSSSSCSTGRSTGSASPASSSASAPSWTCRSLLGEGVVTTVGASIGVALGDVDIPDADTLVRHADIAMYAAKRSLGNDFLVYEPGLGDTTRTAQGLRGRAGRGDPRRSSCARSTSR